MRETIRLALMTVLLTLKVLACGTAGAVQATVEARGGGGLLRLCLYSFWSAFRVEMQVNLIIADSFSALWTRDELMRRRFRSSSLDCAGASFLCAA